MCADVLCICIINDVPVQNGIDIYPDCTIWQDSELTDMRPAVHITRARTLLAPRTNSIHSQSHGPTTSDTTAYNFTGTYSANTTEPFKLLVSGFLASDDE